MSNTRFFNVKTHFTENMASLLMSVIFADFAKESCCFMREKHAVQSVHRTADIAEIGMSHTVTSRDFVCQSPNQKPQIFLRLCSLGAYCPQSPEKMNERRNNVYERYTNGCACHGKRKR